MPEQILRQHSDNLGGDLSPVLRKCIDDGSIFAYLLGKYIFSPFPIVVGIADATVKVIQGARFFSHDGFTRLLAMASQLMTNVQGDNPPSANIVWPPVFPIDLFALFNPAEVFYFDIVNQYPSGAPGSQVRLDWLLTHLDNIVGPPAVARQTNYSFEMWYPCGPQSDRISTRALFFPPVRLGSALDSLCYWSSTVYSLIKQPQSAVAYTPGGEFPVSQITGGAGPATVNTIIDVATKISDGVSKVLTNTGKIVREVLSNYVKMDISQFASEQAKKVYYDDLVQKANDAKEVLNELERRAPKSVGSNGNGTAVKQLTNTISQLADALPSVNHAS